MDNSATKNVKKSYARFLKLLSNQNASEPIFENVNSYTLTIGSKSYTFAKKVVQDCISKNLVDLKQDGISISAEGKAVLVQLLHPDLEYRSQHFDLVQKTITQNGIQKQVTVNENESPLSRLYYRRDKNGRSWLNEDEYKAGERLRADFERSQLQPRISANWEASVCSKSKNSNAGADISDFAVDARRRVEQTIAVLGPELSGVALDVCCYLKGLEVVERERSWPSRSGKLMLRTALRELVRHYSVRPQKRPAKIQQWGVDGFRPAAFQ